MIRTAVIILLTTIISVPVWASRPAAPVSELMLPIKVETPRTGVFSLIPPIESSLTSSRKIASEGESTLDRLMQAEMVEYAKRYLGCRYRRGSKGRKLSTAPDLQAMSTESLVSRSAGHRGFRVRRVLKYLLKMLRSAI